MDEQINQRIAEACGWKPAPRGRWKLNEHVERFRPDYLNDLNAMHEAEKMLNINEQYLYWYCLFQICDDKEEFAPLHATAAERAEAFLRTLNLWKP